MITPRQFETWKIYLNKIDPGGPIRQDINFAMLIGAINKLLGGKSMGIDCFLPDFMGNWLKGADKSPAGKARRLNELEMKWRQFVARHNRNRSA